MSSAANSLAMIPLPTISVLVFAIAVVFSLGRKVVNHIRYKRAQKSKGCLSPKRFKHYEPFLGLDLLYAMAKALKEHRFLNWQKEFFAAQDAKTFEATLLGSRMLYSSEPENMKAMSTSVEQDFGVEPIRNGNGAVTPFTSHGTSTSDGEMWQYRRTLIKPYFDRDGYRNLHRLEVHVDKLLELIPTDNSTFDLQPLLQRWFLDTSTEFLYGESLDSLTNPENAEVAWAMVDVMRGVRLRLQMNKFLFLYKDKTWFDAVALVHRFVDGHIDKTLKQLQDSKTANYPTSATGDERNDLLWVMAKQLQEKKALRSQILAVFVPSNDTTSILISNAFYALARHPKIWEKLHEEVKSIGHATLNFESLRSLRYLNWVLNETHRLYPNGTQMVRIALRDTSLPVGGGPDGKAPIFVQKGDVVHCNRYLMHREPDIWGEDAEEFRPERWEHVRPMWKFVPFGGGPRICPAHVLVATEASYVMVRFAQRFKAIGARDLEPYQAVMRIGPSNRHGCKVAFELA